MKCEDLINKERNLPQKDRTVFKFGIPGTGDLLPATEEDEEESGDEYPSDDSVTMMRMSVIESTGNQVDQSGTQNKY